MCRLVKPYPNEFNVFCHGDAWLNNLLFSNDEKNNSTDILFIDYKISFWTSPAYDLCYTFTTSTQSEIKEQEFDILINVFIMKS